MWAISGLPRLPVITSLLQETTFSWGQVGYMLESRALKYGPSWIIDLTIVFPHV